MATNQPQRLQINTNFGQQQLQTQARPVAQVTSRQNPDYTATQEWEKLADIFASGERIAERVAIQKKSDDEDRASAWAQSKSVQELGEEVKSGKLLASESPVFVATVQNINGRNQSAALQRETLSAIEQGTLRFKDAAEADAYLTGKRNEVLNGASKYGIAGFDVGYADFRPRLFEAVARRNDRDHVAEAVQASSDALRNDLQMVTADDYAGTPQEGAAAILERFNFLRITGALPEDSAMETLKGTLQAAAASGRVQLVRSILDAKHDDGKTFRANLRDAAAITLENQAEGVHEGLMRDQVDRLMEPSYKQASEGTLDEARLRAFANDPKYEKYVTSPTVQSLIDRNNAAIADKERQVERATSERAIKESEETAMQRWATALRIGDTSGVTGTNRVQVLRKDGTYGDWTEDEKFAARFLAADSRMQGLTLPQQASVWARVDIKNPDWEHTLKAGALNLDTLRLTGPGKPAGELSDQARGALELFRQINAARPSYARSLVGEETYNLYSDILMMSTTGGHSQANAAAIVMGARSGAINSTDTGPLKAEVGKAVRDLTDDPWYRPAWAAWMFGDNADANLSQVSGTLRRQAELLALSGQARSAKEAVSAAAAWLADPTVSAKVNGTYYLRSQLPTAPTGESQEEYFEGFIKDLPESIPFLRSYKSEDVWLNYSETTGTYTPMVHGVPATDENGRVIGITRAQIERRYAVKRKAAIDEVMEAAAHKQFVTRMNAEIGKMPAYTMERYDPSYFNQGQKDLFSRETWRRIRADGNADKTAPEILDLYPTKAWTRSKSRKTKAEGQQ